MAGGKGRAPPGFSSAVALLLSLTGGAPAALADGAAARQGCAAIGGAVDAAAATGPVFIASYPDGTRPAALRGAAFVYDNALAVMALLACGEAARAARIGAALRIAAMHDRFWHDGRLRNAYRAGAVAEGAGSGPPALPGWWDAAAGRWDEDGYQMGTATGNVAWAALALLDLGTPADRAAAASLMRWVRATVATPRGFAGGFFGEEPGPARLAWVSTEHNVDAAAAFGRLAEADPSFAGAAGLARGFVAAMWEPVQGRFWLGTGSDGVSVNRAGSGIDAQLWPLIGVAGAPAEWRRAIGWVRAHHAVGGGYGFAASPDGMWTEGTAQAALVMRDRTLWPVIEAQLAPDGYLYAAATDRLRTGLALRPDSVTDDLYYYRLPHLGATAWAVLAELGVNPFAPIPVGAPH